MEGDGKRINYSQPAGLSRRCATVSPQVLFPEIDALYGVPAPAKWHPEIDTGLHTLMTVTMAAMLSPDVDVRFATLCHDLGKG